MTSLEPATDSSRQPPRRRVHHLPMENVWARLDNQVVMVPGLAFEPIIGNVSLRPHAALGRELCVDTDEGLHLSSVWFKTRGRA